MSYLTDIFARRPSASGPLLDNACLTAEERDLASRMCQAVTIQGVGLGRVFDEWDASRWADYPACNVLNLPLCPACTDVYSAAAIFGCFAGQPPEGWSSAQHDNWCAQVGAGMMLQPICGGVVQELPSCADGAVRSVLDYCTYYGFGGPVGELNAACWLADKGGYLAEALELPPCPTAAPVPPAAQPPPPTVTYTPTATAPPTTVMVPPEEFGPPPPPPEEPGEERPEAQRAGMMLPGLILLLVVGGGIAYYTAQRRRRPGRARRRR